MSANVPLNSQPNSTPERKRGIFIGRVVENRPLCREHFLLRVDVPALPPTEPGQFVQLLCREPGVQDPLLRRPFSLAGRDGNTIDVIHRVVGSGTAYLSHLAPGDALNILGPLGNAFPLPAPRQQALLVGGGVGIPPMIYLAALLAAHRQPAIAFAGAVTGDLLSLSISAPPKTDGAPSLCITEFARHGIPTAISTDDGSVGLKGYVTQALESHLRSLPADAAAKPVIYTCGPEAMMKRVADIAAAFGVTCHVAVERAMACGMGTCQSCCIRVSDPAKPDAWRYALACTEGPVFDSRRLLW